MPAARAPALLACFAVVATPVHALDRDAEILVSIAGCIIGCALLSCLAHYCLRSGVTGALDSLLTGGHASLSMFRAQHAEHLRPPPARWQRRPVELGYFREGVGGGGEGGFDIAYDDETDVHHLQMHVAHVGKFPMAVQSSRPLAWPSAAVDVPVYFELQLNDVARGATVAVGWATFVAPPFMLAGEAAHSVALRSADGEGLAYVDSDAPREALRVSGPPLRAGDVLGVGYVQHRAAAGAGLDIEFFWAVNGRTVEVPRGRARHRAINREWSRAEAFDAEAGNERPEDVGVGILANGCAFPTISATGRFDAFVKFSPPFEYYTGPTLPTQGSRALNRRASTIGAPTAGKGVAPRRPSVMHSIPSSHERSTPRARPAYAGGRVAPAAAVVDVRDRDDVRAAGAASPAAARFQESEERRQRLRRERSLRRVSAPDLRELRALGAAGGAGQRARAGRYHTRHGHHHATVVPVGGGSATPHAGEGGGGGGGGSSSRK